MTDVRVVSFNVNQNSPAAHQRADLLERMADADRVSCQETVDLDLAAFVADPKTIAKVGVWGAIQVRNGDNDGHANTAVLYRISAGVPSETVCVPIGDAADTRARFLTGGLFPEGWDWSAHIFPRRDSADIAAELRAIGAWVKAHPRQHAGGLDKNQASVSALEHATGLTWHGKGIDGFLTSLPLKGLAEFPKGFSDHPGVHAVVTLPDTTPPEDKPVAKPTVLDRIIASLRKARNAFTARGKTTRAKRVQAGIDAIKKDPTPPKPKPQPAPVPAAVHGFMPGALNKNITPGSNDPAIIPCGVVFHVAVSTSDSLHDFFNGPSGGIESHFYVRFDGTIEQYRSIFFEADAQLQGNSFGSPRKGFVSVETEGMGDGKWTAAQIDGLKRIVQFVHSQEAFPLRVAPAWDGPGVGYHAMFKEWNPNAHSCPGPNRIVQFKNVIVPWLNAGAK